MYGQWVGDMIGGILLTYASVRETQAICNPGPPPPENVILIEITSNQPQSDSKEQVEAAIAALKKLKFDK